jgi:hypothetical protein
VQARCRALADDSPNAGSLYEEVLEHVGQTSWLTEVARTHLVYGEGLRAKARTTLGYDARRLRSSMPGAGLSGLRPQSANT